MQLSPRYGSDPLIVLDGDPAVVGPPLVAQQRRFVEALGRLDADQWAAPSRCAGWSARDVLVHLESATAFWVFSLARGLAGEPTTFLSNFDPVATPAQMAAGSSLDGPGVLERFVATTAAFAAALEALDDAGWRTLVEAPPGHISASAMAHHAIWDSWVHERDVFLPLGIDVPVVAAEVVPSLRYVAALGPAFAVNGGHTSGGVLRIQAHDPAVEFSVIAGPSVRVVDGASAADASDTSASSAASAAMPEVVVTGPALDLLEGFSRRAQLSAVAPPVPDEAAWLLDGLAEVFDQT